MRRSDIVGAWIIDAAKIEKRKYEAECTFRRHEHSSIHKMSPIETNPRSWKCPRSRSRPDSSTIWRKAT